MDSFNKADNSSSAAKKKNLQPKAQETGHQSNAQQELSGSPDAVSIQQDKLEAIDLYSREHKASKSKAAPPQKQPKSLFTYLASVSILFSGVFAAVGFYSWTLLAQIGTVNNNEVRNSVVVDSKPASAPANRTDTITELSVSKNTTSKSKVAVAKPKVQKTVHKTAQKTPTKSKTKPKIGQLSQKIAKVAAPPSKKVRVQKKAAKLSSKRPYSVKRRVPPPPQFYVEDDLPLIEGPQFIEPY